MRPPGSVVTLVGLLLLALPLLAVGCSMSCTGDEEANITTVAGADSASTTLAVPSTSEEPPETAPEVTSSHPSLTHPSPGTTVSSEPTTTTTGDTEPEGPEVDETTLTLPPIRTLPSVIPTIVPGGDPWTRYEDDNPYLSWTGPWAAVTDPDVSGGSYKLSDGAGRLLAYFEGTRVALVAVVGPDRGNADVYLQPVPSGDAEHALIDLYHPSKGLKTVWTSDVLPEGTYYLFVWWTGFKNPAATGTRITVDAVDIVGTLRPWLGP